MKLCVQQKQQPFTLHQVLSFFDLGNASSCCRFFWRKQLRGPKKILHPSFGCSYGRITSFPTVIFLFSFSLFFNLFYSPPYHHVPCKIIKYPSPIFALKSTVSMYLLLMGKYLKMSYRGNHTVAASLKNNIELVPVKYLAFFSIYLPTFLWVSKNACKESNLFNNPLQYSPVLAIQIFC